MSYHAENRLVSVSGAATASFVYDPDGARVIAIENGTWTAFVGSHYETTATGSTRYYLAGASRVAMRKSGALTYLLADHLGSSSLSTDVNGNRTSELRYKAWGETRFSYGTMPTRYTFTGQFSYDVEFGLKYYNARWLDNTTGRFTQPDTLVPAPNNTQSWDRFAYVGNNPLLYSYCT